jgi:hypothetical protein
LVGFGFISGFLTSFAFVTSNVAQSPIPPTDSTTLGLLAFVASCVTTADSEILDSKITCSVVRLSCFSHVWIIKDTMFFISGTESFHTIGLL